MADDEEVTFTMHQGMWKPTGEPFFTMAPVTDEQVEDLKRRWSQTIQGGRIMVLPSPRRRRRTYLALGAFIAGFWLGAAVVAVAEWVASRG